MYLIQRKCVPIYMYISCGLDSDDNQVAKALVAQLLTVTSRHKETVKMVTHHIQLAIPFY